MSRLGRKGIGHFSFGLGLCIVLTDIVNRKKQHAQEKEQLREKHEQQTEELQEEIRACEER